VAHHLETEERVGPSTTLLSFASKGPDLQMKNMTQMRIEIFGICGLQETIRTGGVSLNIRRTIHWYEQDSTLSECTNSVGLTL
jgi:hypothetical protein